MKEYANIKDYIKDLKDKRVAAGKMKESDIAFPAADYKKSPADDDSQAQFELGLMYRNRWNYQISDDSRYWKRNVNKALGLLNQAAKNGHPDAAHAFALVLFEYYRSFGKPDNFDINDAIEIIKLAAEKKDVRALYMLAEICRGHGNISFYYGIYSPYLYSMGSNEALKLYEEDQKNGFKKAIEYYTAAAQPKVLEPGHASSQYQLGNLNKTSNPQVAEHWYKLAADQNHPQAQYELGLLQKEKKNYVLAAYWLRRAAEQNVEYARYYLHDLTYQSGLSDKERYQIQYHEFVALKNTSKEFPGEDPNAFFEFVKEDKRLNNEQRKSLLLILLDNNEREKGFWEWQKDFYKRYKKLSETRIAEIQSILTELEKKSAQIQPAAPEKQPAQAQANKTTNLYDSEPGPLYPSLANFGQPAPRVEQPVQPKVFDIELPVAKSETTEPSAEQPPLPVASAPELDKYEQIFQQAQNYQLGRDVKKNLKEAEKLYKTISQNQGVDSEIRAKALYECGIIYLAQENNKEALRAFEAAANLGDARAKCKSGELYIEGKGSSAKLAKKLRDAKGMEYLHDAADKDNLAEAQVKLAELYYEQAEKLKEKGKELEASELYKKAFEYNKKAADQHDPIGQENLGNLYRLGHGVDQDYIEANRLFEMARTKGRTNSLVFLGNAYENGQGVERNVIKAAQYFYEADQKKNKHAREFLDRIYKKNPGLKEYIKYLALKDQNKSAALVRLQKATKPKKGFAEAYEAYGDELLKTAPKDAEYYYSMAVKKGCKTAEIKLIKLRGLENTPAGAAEIYIKYSQEKKKLGLAEKQETPETTELLINAAICGHPAAQYQLAANNYHLDENNPLKDNKFAHYWAMKAAEKGHSKAMVAVGRDFYLGRGVEKDIAKAVEYYEKARQHGNTDAINWLGLIKRGAKDHTAAGKLFQEAADQNDPIGLHNLANAYADGLGVEKDVVKAAILLRKIIEQNLPREKHKETLESTEAALKKLHKENPDLEARINYSEKLNKEISTPEEQYQRAQDYLDEKNPFKNKALAKEWYTKAAEQGHAGAINELGVMKWNEGKYEEAADFFHKAADKNNPEALQNLATCYRAGRGVAKDVLLAAKLYDAALELQPSMPAAIRNRAKLFEENLGLEDYLQAEKENNEQAEYYYAIAAQKGFLPAKIKLAQLNEILNTTITDPEKQYQRARNYLDEKNPLKNNESAHYWAMKAAEQGHSDAMVTVGDNFYFGRGVEKDIAKAVEYYEKARELENIRAINGLGMIKLEEQKYDEAAELFREAARAGNLHSLQNLASVIVQKNVVQAVKIYDEVIEEAARTNQDIPAAGKNRAKVLQANPGLEDYLIYLKLPKDSKDPNDIRAALEALLRAGQKGFAEAYVEATEIYLKVYKQNPTDIEALKSAEYYYSMAVQKGNETIKEALDNLRVNIGSSYYACAEKSQNTEAYRDAVEEYKKAAKYQHNPKECYARIGNICSDKKPYGLWDRIWNRLNNDTEAFNAFEQAANLENAEAQSKLGAWYYLGMHGVKKDYKKAIELFEKAAAQNNLDAIVFLGHAYENGNGVEKDVIKAAQLFLSAHEKGDKSAKDHLDRIYKNNPGLEQYMQAPEKDKNKALNDLGLAYWNKQEYEKAFRLFKQAVERGNRHAIQNLAACYHTGNGVPKDAVMAMALYSKVQDIPAAQRNLEKLLKSKPGLKEYMDYLNSLDEKSLEALEAEESEEQLALWKKFVAAANFDPNDSLERWVSDIPDPELEKNKNSGGHIEVKELSAQEKAELEKQKLFDRGNHYLKNRPDLWGNDKAAFKAFKQAADLEHAGAQLELAELCEKGVGTKQNYADALKYYKKAADQNFEGAQEAFGAAKERMYQEAIQPFPILTHAFNPELIERQRALLTTLAETYNYAPAQYSLAYYYQYKTNAQVPKKIEGLYQAAADQGHTDAMIRLGLRHWDKKEWDQAFNWFQKAADKNDHAGLYDTALCYAQGKGVKKDVVEAAKRYLETIAKISREGKYKSILEDSETNLDNLYKENPGLEDYLNLMDPRSTNVAKTAEGFAAELHRLGAMSERDRNYNRAFNLYRRAAELENKEALSKVAEMYRKGVGTEQNSKLAEEYANKALEQMLHEIQAIPVGNSTPPVAEMPSKSPKEIAAELYKKQLENTDDTGKSKSNLYPDLSGLSQENAAASEQSKEKKGREYYQEFLKLRYTNPKAAQIAAEKALEYYKKREDTYGLGLVKYELFKNIPDFLIYYLNPELFELYRTLLTKLVNDYGYKAALGRLEEYERNYKDVQSDHNNNSGAPNSDQGSTAPAAVPTSAVHTYKTIVNSMPTPTPAPALHVENKEKTGEEFYKDFLKLKITNPKEARIALEKSASLGFSEAQNTLGIELEKEGNFLEAGARYRDAAGLVYTNTIYEGKNPNARAVFNLARMYEYGKGVIVNKKLAKHFFDYAESKGITRQNQAKSTTATFWEEAPSLPDVPTHKPELPAEPEKVSDTKAQGKKATKE